MLFVAVDPALVIFWIGAGMLCVGMLGRLIEQHLLSRSLPASLSLGHDFVKC